MEYTVTHYFYDLQDGDYYYKPGEKFPRANAEYDPSKERFKQIEKAGFIKKKSSKKTDVEKENEKE